MNRRRLLAWTVLVWVPLGGAAAAGGKAFPRPQSGYCTIQPTYAGCLACCDTEQRIGGFLTGGCTSTVAAGAGSLGGTLGAIVGGALGRELCTLVLQESTCWERCEGKDGDPSPIACVDPETHTEGVCRQVCEDGANNLGPAGCPPDRNLTCCVHEYDPPDGCPEDECPGIACPPGCNPVSS